MKNLVSKKNESTGVLPNFLIVGAAKCGTTSLYHYLRQHPDVYMSPVKEPRFLSDYAAHPGKGPGDDFIAQKCVVSFDDYLGLFKKGAGKKAVGEASVDTLFHFEQTIPAIKRYLGDPRIVIILRDPVERAYSAYNYLSQDGYEELSFKNAIIAEEQHKRDGYRCIWKYREGGLYARRVRAFQEIFSRVQVLLYDDLKKDALSLLRSLYAFLDVNPNFIPNIRHRHNTTGVPRWKLLNNLFTKPRRLHKVARTIGGSILGANRWIRLRERVRLTVLKKPPPMDPQIQRELRRFYRNDILKLQDYIGRNLSSWLEEKH